RQCRARQNAGATCRPFARSPARVPPPPCCSSPRHSPIRCAPATPKPAPSCVGAYSLPRYPQPQPTVRSWLPDDPFASPALTPMHFVSSNYHTNFRLSTLVCQVISAILTFIISSASGAKCRPKVSLLPPSGPATASLLCDWCIGWPTI